ncbi:hypothetical protein [Fructobacillus tropaeoli]|uniref:hypothetical protein n=1 Tax=Fructobacillus tropaeoli TaxID=709323 RepID=UPI0030C7CCF4
MAKRNQHVIFDENQHPDENSFQTIAKLGVESPFSLTFFLTFSRLVSVTKT